MRWLPTGLGAVVITIVSISWRDVTFIVTRGSSGSQTPSGFELWWLERMDPAVLALAIVAVLTVATSRRAVLVLTAMLLAAGAAWLAFWQTSPPAGTLTPPPTFGSAAWVCVGALAVAALVTSWRARTGAVSGSLTDPSTGASVQESTQEGR